MKGLSAAGLFLAALLACAPSHAEDTPAVPMPAASGLGIPDIVDSRIGSLRFFDGFPDSATIKATYDYLDFSRGVQLYLGAAPVLAQMATRDALRAAGAINGTLAVAQGDAASAGHLLLGWLSLKTPLVVDSPPDATLSLADQWGRQIALRDDTDPGAATIRTLVVPPAYKGRIPAGFRVASSRTSGVLLSVQLASADPDPQAALMAVRDSVRVYPLAQAGKPPRSRIVTLRAKPAPALPPARSFDLIDRLVQEEPADALDADKALLLDAVGIRKGVRFRPDGRTKTLLDEAAKVGDAIVRTMRSASRDAAVEAPADAARVTPAPQGPAETIESRIGKLKFEDGIPTPDTVRLVYDHLDFMHGVEAFLGAMGGATASAWKSTLGELGIDNGTLGIFENSMDNRARVLTGDAEAVLVLGQMDLSAGPMVVESPLGMHGEIRSAWWQPLVVLGATGPDKGKGGSYLVVPPGYAESPPKGYHVVRSTTMTTMVWWRGLRLRGDPDPAIDNARRSARIYPMGGERPLRGEFVNLSGRDLSTLVAADAGFYDKIAQVLAQEPVESPDPGIAQLLGALGMAKDQSFTPDDRRKAILEEAAVVGDATARSIVFASRFAELFPWPRSQWQASHPGSPANAFEPHALELRTRATYYVHGFAGAIDSRYDAGGMQSALIFRDARGEGLDGGRHYRLRLPPRIPANRGWSLVPYDNQTRSMLQTEQNAPGVSDRRPGLQRNPDGSIDLWFGPEAPAGRKSNWVQTLPDKGWSLVLRLYAPGDAWYARRWRPGEIEPLK